MNFPSNFERELTDDGECASRNVGKFCAKANIHFTHAFVSPLVRAKQTAQLVLNELPKVKLEETEFLTPDTDPKNLFTLLQSFTSDSRILLVTHEPFVSTCISTLISGTKTANIAMKPASFVCVETNGVPSRGNGKLLWLVTSDMMKKLLS